MDLSRYRCETSGWLGEQWSSQGGVVLTCVVHGERIGCVSGDHPMPESTKE
jgi:hypothetical protein